IHSRIIELKMPHELSSTITYVGLGISIVSLLSCLVIECLVWKSVVKSSVSYCRHTAHINICLCLLVADCSFLASAFPDMIPENWCQIFVVIKHLCYLSMFFWMLCLSIMVLHQMIFMFHQMSKKVCLGLCFSVGYCCPLLIVFITFITYNSGQKDYYYTTEACWLVYEGFLKGSIFAFILPVGTIVVVNVFCMLVVIIRLLRPSLEVNTKDEKEVAKGILKAVVLLTPIFGGTWIFGFFVLMFDITKGPIAYLVNYAFTLLNAFQVRLRLGLGQFHLNSVNWSLHSTHCIFWRKTGKLLKKGPIRPFFLNIKSFIGLWVGKRCQRGCWPVNISLIASSPTAPTKQRKHTSVSSRTFWGNVSFSTNCLHNHAKV
uniref:G-protein coupled receptors family 2 profile 2 domain-containing protein n=1 Tax=Oncorhynchus mykiss TaxID=8022 RepID=A0A8C7UT58_ONCMY